jgi:hypothetical protein
MWYRYARADLLSWSESACRISNDSASAYKRINFLVGEMQTCCPHMAGNES